MAWTYVLPRWLKNFLVDFDPRRSRMATCKPRDIGHRVSSHRLERHMFLFTISMYIYVNGEHGTRVRGGVGCRRRDANELRLCGHKFFHSLGKHIAISWISIIIERTVGEEFGLNFSLEDLLNPNFWNRVWKFRIDICDNTVFEFLVWVFLSFLVVRLVRFKVWNFETVKIRYRIISVLRSTKDSNF